MLNTKNNYTIGLDAGHGGYDSGAIGAKGLKEKDVTLPITLMVNQFLIESGLKTTLTRWTDTALATPANLDLRARTDLLNKAKVDYTVSIHINSATNRDANYISTFIIDKGGKAEELANKVQMEMVKTIGWADGGVRTANLHMIRETKMPAILVECGFISNLKQEEQLRDTKVQNKIARAIADGILKYLGKEIVTMPDWKEQIMLDAAKAGLIDGNHGHNPDDRADKWFVLAVMLNMLNQLKK